MGKDTVPDIVAVVESKLDAMKAGSEDAKLAIKPPFVKTGPRTIVWFKSGLAPRDLGDKFDPSNHDVSWFCVKRTNGRNVVLGAIYHPPAHI